jgi:DNA-binding LacI/PurR family transcriptional regulator
MCSALGTLKDEGVVTIVKTRGAYLGAPPAENRGGWAGGPWNGSQRWQRLKAQIESDIFNGHYPAGEPMPSLRDLEKSYAVSYKTLRKAMESIAAEGVVAPYKKTYLVPNLRKAHATLVFVSAADAPSRISFGGFPLTEFLSALRREGGKSMISVAVQAFHPDRRRADFASQLKALQEKYSVLGYVFWAALLQERKLDQALELLLEARESRGRPGGEKPLAVVDPTLDLISSRGFLPPPGGEGLRVFTVAGLSAGRQVGQNLLKLGHRKIAYISYCHKELWSQLRCRGLLQAFQNAGFGDGLRKFVIEEADDRIHVLPPPSDIGEYLKRAEGFLAASAEAGRKYHAAYALEQMQNAVGNYVHQLKMADRVEPVLNAALEEPGITACVAANDRMALLVRDHLVRKGLRVPKDMSVIGFDDSKAAVDNDIASYSFAFAEIARKVLGYVLDPRQKFQAREGMTVECEGQLIERGSSGPPRGGG